MLSKITLSTLALFGALGTVGAQDDCRVTTGIFTTAEGQQIDTVYVGDGQSDLFTLVPTYDVFASTATILADADYNLLAINPDTDQIELDGVAAGTYNLFFLTYTGDIRGDLAFGEPVYNQQYSTECWLISDNEIIVDARPTAPLPCDSVVTTGIITTTEGQRIDTVYVGDLGADVVGLTATYALNASVAYIVTDADYVITDIYPDVMSADLSYLTAGETYNIFLLTYTGTLNTDVVGQSVYTPRYTDACWLISENEIIIEVEEAPCRETTGIITTADGQRIDTLHVTDGVADVITVVATYDVFERTAVIVADENYNLVALYADTDSVDLEGVTPGKYNLFLLTYRGNLGSGFEGQSVYTIMYTDQCWLISNNEIIVYAEDGMMEGDDSSDGDDSSEEDGNFLKPNFTVDAFQPGPGADLNVRLTPREDAAQATDAHGPVMVMLTNVNGQVVARRAVAGPDAATTVGLPVAGQRQGTYILSVVSRDGIQSERTVIR